MATTRSQRRTALIKSFVFRRAGNGSYWLGRLSGNDEGTICNGSLQEFLDVPLNAVWLDVRVSAKKPRIMSNVLTLSLAGDGFHISVKGTGPAKTPYFDYETTKAIRGLLSTRKVIYAAFEWS